MYEVVIIKSRKWVRFVGYIMMFLKVPEQNHSNNIVLSVQLIRYVKGIVRPTYLYLLPQNGPVAGKEVEGGEDLFFFLFQVRKMFTKESFVGAGGDCISSCSKVSL